MSAEVHPASGLRRVLLLFVDGVGLAPAGPGNPFSEIGTPALSSLLEGGLTAGSVSRRRDTSLAALDACLGVPGLPQSATGQTALFTGENAPQRLGRHVPALPGPRLREIIEEHSVFRRARERGLAATFANAFSDTFFEPEKGRRPRYSVTVWAVRAGGGRFRSTRDLERGEAVSWDVERDLFARRSGAPVARIAAATAGRQLVSLASRYDFTVFETFLPDLAGHHRFGLTAEVAVSRIDGLLQGVLEARPPEMLVTLTSDHGNLEESAHRRHTRNPVPLLAVGPDAAAMSEITTIAGVSPRILDLLARGRAQSPS